MSALLFLVLLPFPLVTNAAPGEFMPEARPIQSIIVEGDSGGNAVVIIQGGVPVDYIPAGCNSPYNMLDLSTSKGRGQLAVALSAYSLGKPVRLALQCIGDRPLVSHILF